MTLRYQQNLAGKCFFYGTPGELESAVRRVTQLKHLSDAGGGVPEEPPTLKSVDRLTAAAFADI